MVHSFNKVLQEKKKLLLCSRVDFFRWNYTNKLQEATMREKTATNKLVMEDLISLDESVTIENVLANSIAR